MQNTSSNTENFLQASSMRYLFSVLVGGGAFLAGILVDVGFGIENRPILYSDILTGLIAALLAFFVARYYERLRRVRHRTIAGGGRCQSPGPQCATTVLYSVHVKCDPELIQVTQDAVNRIDWILREVLWESDLDPSHRTSRLHDSR